MVGRSTKDQLPHPDDTGRVGRESWWIQRRGRDVQSILRSLEPLPSSVSPVALVIMSGLPGSGKTFLARRLASRIGGVVLHSDKTRKLLVPQPRYSPSENARVFSAMHAVTAVLVERAVPVVFDATNLLETDRRPLYRIAKAHGVPWLLVRTIAPPEVIRERMMHRAAGSDPLDLSDADWGIYEVMRRRVQPIRNPHIVVHASEPTEEAVERIVRTLGHAFARPPGRSTD